MAHAAEIATPIAWWREPSREQWHAWIAAWLGWVLDAFDFTIFLLIMAPIAKDFDVPLVEVTAVFTITLTRETQRETQLRRRDVRQARGRTASSRGASPSGQPVRTRTRSVVTPIERAPLTIFLAKLIGLYCVLYGVAMALEKQAMVDIVAALLVRLDPGELRQTAVGDQVLLDQRVRV